MSTGNKIREVIEKFDPITLDQMDKVKLMRRTDTKFVFSRQELPNLLKKAIDNYYMVVIKDEKEQIYKTTYFDTQDYKMYRLHHNGKLNRHKVRIRKYVYSEQEFLEIKRKNNRGETIKNRINHTEDKHQIDVEGSKDFVKKYSNYNSDLLEPMLGNHFIRLTLVNKNFSERITIDYKLKFKDLKNNLETQTRDVCIIEIKKGRDNKSSPFINYLKEQRIQSMGFSKYCIGMALLNPEVKNNNFKQRIRTIVKI